MTNEYANVAWTHMMQMVASGERTISKAWDKETFMTWFNKKPGTHTLLQLGGSSKYGAAHTLGCTKIEADNLGLYFNSKITTRVEEDGRYPIHIYDIHGKSEVYAFDTAREAHYTQLQIVSNTLRGLLPKGTLVRTGIPVMPVDGRIDLGYRIPACEEGEDYTEVKVPTGVSVIEPSFCESEDYHTHFIDVDEETLISTIDMLQCHLGKDYIDYELLHTKSSYFLNTPMTDEI